MQRAAVAADECTRRDNKHGLALVSSVSHELCSHQVMDQHGSILVSSRESTNTALTRPATKLWARLHPSFVTLIQHAAHRHSVNNSNTHVQLSDSHTYYTDRELL